MYANFCAHLFVPNKLLSELLSLLLPSYSRMCKSVTLLILLIQLFNISQ